MKMKNRTLAISRSARGNAAEAGTTAAMIAMMKKIAAYRKRMGPPTDGLLE